MLKRLELLGFKSFADKTHFDFGRGITAIVGPNGSGKSNVVDAVRWILGEQSAKSLRGGEMADVIFNGSASRRSLGLAEVTLTLDNSRRYLSLDMDDVQITRRVYRSGDGEYLINKQPARLKDIKDLFLGTGAATDAYAIIEQGRVDILLQASTRERRTIFEEAAGISRFKTKKVEALRKLEHVEQNLVRLRDIIEEVERQLRSVKLQASKAQRFQEYSERLKTLRVALSLAEYHQLSQQLTQVTDGLSELRQTVKTHADDAARWEADVQRLEHAIAKLDSAARSQELILTAARERIAAEETTLQHEQALAASLDEDIAQTRIDIETGDQDVQGAARQAERTSRELEEVESHYREQTSAVERLEAELAGAAAALTRLRDEVQTDKAELMEQMRLAAREQNELVALQAQAESLAQHRGRLEEKSGQVTQNLLQLDSEVRELRHAEEHLQTRLEGGRQSLNLLRRQQDDTRHTGETIAQQLGSLREQRSAKTSRIQVLEDLEQSHEGLTTGVREMLELLRQPEVGPWRTVAGLVADLLTVPREYAPLVDLALGERAQYFVAQDISLLTAAIEEQAERFSGRVSFLSYSPRDTGLAGAAGCDAEGVIASAASITTCSRPDLAGLPGQLLGSTWIVRNLHAARALSAAMPGARFVTLNGELLEADGSLTVGAHGAESGMLSRKSELRELHEQARVIDDQIIVQEREAAGLRETLARLDSRVEEAQNTLQVLAEQAAELRTRLDQQRQRHEGLAQEVQANRVEIKQLDAELTAVMQGRKVAEAEARAADDRVQAIQTGLEAKEAEIRGLDNRRQQLDEACTGAKVAAAAAEERHAAVQARHQRALHDFQELQAELRRRQQHLETVIRRIADNQETMQRAATALAQAHAEKQDAEKEIERFRETREQLSSERQHYVETAQVARQEWQTVQEQVHAAELEANDLQHRLESLATRLREDHDLDLIALYQQAIASGVALAPRELPAPNSGALSRGADATPLAPDPSSLNPQEEIAELKRKISRLGNVNLEALEELHELETRVMTLKAQHDDLNSAKQSLDQIIQKINQDSRRMFAETLETVRGHFQELFRKLFGGGMADIVLEEGDDILESGIEIIARPPGKELRSISLLSGGEKTLTAVALLLAIFRSRPSPFCILDEVDAALDEANIGRYTAVLREFLDQSQFIIITHSKKTMSSADVLYGITMQESGISKQVAVRFEDWPDEAASTVADDLSEENDAMLDEADRAESAA